MMEQDKELVLFVDGNLLTRSHLEGSLPHRKGAVVSFSSIEDAGEAPLGREQLMWCCAPLMRSKARPTFAFVSSSPPAGMGPWSFGSGNALNS